MNSVCILETFTAHRDPVVDMDGFFVCLFLATTWKEFPESLKTTYILWHCEPAKRKTLLTTRAAPF